MKFHRQTLPNVIQHFGNNTGSDDNDEDTDLSVEIRMFITSYMTEESQTLRYEISLNFRMI